MYVALDKTGSTGWNLKTLQGLHCYSGWLDSHNMLHQLTSENLLCSHYWLHSLPTISQDMCQGSLCALETMVAMPAAGVVNNPGCPYMVGRQCGACGVLALYHWSEMGPEVAVGYLGTPVMMLLCPSISHVSMTSSLRDGPQLTMRLLCDHIRMAKIRYYLADLVCSGLPLADLLKPHPLTDIEGLLQGEVVTHNLSADVAHPPDTLSHLEKHHASNSNVTFDAGLISLGAKEPSSEQQGMFEMPAFSNSDFRSSSLSSWSKQLWSFVWLLLGDIPLAISCIMPLSELVEMALFSNATASLFSPAVRDGTKESSSEQQGHTVVDAATRSTTHLVQTNLRHHSSRGRDRIFEHTTPLQLIQDGTLFWLANVG
eukprot:Em0001g2862a